MGNSSANLFPRNFGVQCKLRPGVGVGSGRLSPDPKISKFRLQSHGGGV